MKNDTDKDIGVNQTYNPAAKKNYSTKNDNNDNSDATTTLTIEHKHET